MVVAGMVMGVIMTVVMVRSGLGRLLDQLLQLSLGTLHMDGMAIVLRGTGGGDMGKMRGTGRVLHERRLN